VPQPGRSTGQAVSVGRCGRAQARAPARQKVRWPDAPPQRQGGRPRAAASCRSERSVVRQPWCLSARSQVGVFPPTNEVAVQGGKLDVVWWVIRRTLAHNETKAEMPTMPTMPTTPTTPPMARWGCAQDINCVLLWPPDLSGSSRRAVPGGGMAGRRSRLGCCHAMDDQNDVVVGRWCRTACRSCQIGSVMCRPGAVRVGQMPEPGTEPLRSSESPLVMTNRTRPTIVRVQITAKTIQPVLVSRREPCGSVAFLVRATMPTMREPSANGLQTNRLSTERIVRTMAEPFAPVV